MRKRPDSLKALSYENTYLLKERAQTENTMKRSPAPYKPGLGFIQGQHTESVLV